jgi:hypothetical protein
MEANNFYKQKLDSHKRTGFLFGIIPFDFSIPYEIATAIFAVLFLIVSAGTGFIFTSFFLFVLISKEYQRVYQIRDKVLEDCLVSEELFKMEMGENGCDPNFSHDPLYVTDEDRRFFFKDSIGSYKSSSFLRNLLPLIVRSKIIRN